MEEGILRIQLMNGPGARGGDAKDGVDCRRFDNRAKGLVAVDASLLGEAVDDPARLVPTKRCFECSFIVEIGLLLFLFSLDAKSRVHQNPLKNLHA